MLSEKPARTVAWSAALLLAGAILARRAGIGWATVDVAAHLPGGVSEAEPIHRPAAPGVPVRAAEQEHDDEDEPLPPPGSPEEAAGAHAIEDPAGAMRSFYAALAATDARQGGAVTRIVHYGDSILDADLITGVMRRRLQKRFGDAGHGFVLGGTPWPGYRHWDVRHGTRGHWTVSRSTNSPVADGMYGIGGVAFRSAAKGATVWFGTDPQGEVGRAASRAEIHFLRRPGGGDLEVVGPSGVPVLLHTQSDAPVPGVHAIQTPDGPVRIEARAGGAGEVRVFGAVLERDGPGIVYDALNINGARARILLRFDPAHWAESLRARDLDLVIFNFGINESEADHLPMGPYEEILHTLARRVRTAVPDRSCLFVGPMDRAGRDAMGRMRTRPIIRRLRDAQREVALAEGCAFWDAMAAMGGDDASVRWFRLGLVGGDFTHVTPRGGVKLADLLYRALLSGYYGSRSQ